MEFIEKKASELYKSSSGLSKPADAFGYGFPFLSYSDIFNNYYAPKELTTLVNSTEKDRETCSVKRGDVFLTRTSETTEELGMSCVALKDYPNATFNGFAKRLRPITDEIVPEYAAYFFRSSYFRAQCISMASLITRASLNDAMISRFRIRYPKLKKAQATIGNTLMSYDNLIEVNNKRIKVLEQMAENLYKEWFVRFRFPGHETAEFENGIPKGWEYCTVESLSAILQRGISPDYDDDGQLTVISQKCIRKNIMDIKEARRQTRAFKPELNIEDGDTVICSTGTGTLGRVGQVYGDYPNTTFDSHVTLVRAKQKIGRHFLYWTLKELQPWFMNMGIGSTNQQELYRGTIKNAKALCPDNKLVAQFESIIETIHRNIILLIKSQESLIKQRDLLLPRLMSGKLEVL